MDKLKQTLLLGLAAALVVVLGGWYLLISPQHSKVASLQSQTSQQDSTNQALQQQIAQLKSEAQEVVSDQATLAAIAKRLPPNLNEAQLLSDLYHAAVADGVDLQVVTPQTPVSQTAAAPATAAAAAAATTTPAAGSTAAPAATPRTATNAGSSGTQLYAIPLQLTVVGNYFNLEMYVHSLENMQRAMVISQLSLMPSQSEAVTSSAGATVSAAATPTAKSTGTVSKSTGTKGKATKAPEPGSAGAAQAEVQKMQPYAAGDTPLSMTLQGSVFTLFTPQSAALAQAMAAAGSAAPAATSVAAVPAAPTTTLGKAN